MLARLFEVIVEDRGQLVERGDPGPRLKKLERLRLKGVRVAQVLHELPGQIFAALLAQRGVQRAVPHAGRAIGHRSLLLGDALGELCAALVARALGGSPQQLVGRELQVLVGVRVHRQLARRVRVRPSEQHHPPAARASGQVLGPRGRGGALAESLPDETLLLFGLAQVLDEHAGQLADAGQPRRDPELRQRLFLKRVDVSEVLGQLLVGRTLGHVRALHRGVAPRERNKRRRP